VVQAWDVLEGKVRTGRRVVVIGGGAVGMETALLLADKGTLSGDALKFLLLNGAEAAEDLYELASRGTKEVIILEMIEKVGKDIGRSTRWPMMQDAERAGIQMRIATRAVEITESSVKVETGGKVEAIPADTVVLAAGVQAFNPLQETLEKRRIPVQVVGDARTPGKAFDAIHQGFAAGRNV
jgi:2,4-dienoyl-CoA reductase (NADPH2)